MKANKDRGRVLIEEAIRWCTDGGPVPFQDWLEKTRVAIRVALGDNHETISRFSCISFAPMIYTSRTTDAVIQQAQREGVLLALALLRATIVELDANEPILPAIDVGGLHPWVANTASQLWVDGHYRHAVEEAARTIEVRLRAKLGVHDHGVHLVTSAFSSNEPRSGEPRLRFPDFENGTENWKNAHEGASAFGRGCMMRVRNLYVHGHDPSEAEALEALAALSLLARWIDVAVVYRIE